MKKFTTILFIILCSITYSQSKDQSDIGKEGTLYFKDGSEQKGFIKIDDKENIWFRKEKDSSGIYITKEKIEKFNTLTNKETLRNYHYIENPKKHLSNLILVDEDKDFGTLFFKNGTQKNGIIEFKKSNIYFKENKDSDEKVYTFNDVYKLSKNNENGEIDDYEYKLVIEEPKTKVYLFKVLIKGKVSLYSKSYEVFKSYPDTMPFGGISSTISYGGIVVEHYLSKENDLYATKIILNNIRNNHFKLNIAPIFFGDCEYLMGMIKRNVIEKDDFEGVVNYYNSGTKCNQ